MTRRVLNVLCFGDSLTEGYTFLRWCFCRSFHPYSTHLLKLLQEHCQTDVNIETAGVSGETVLPSMTHRLDTLLGKTQPYDWVVILGGTNDLGMNLKSDELLPHLLKLHDRAKETGAKTLALAIPQFRYELSPKNETYKNEKAKVNEGLKQYCEKSASTTFFVDLWSDLPFGTLPEEEKDLYWVDALHMTPQGYDKMARIIFDTLKLHINI